jgi:hypothetical protein
MNKYLHVFLRFKSEVLFHPESPGIKVNVTRSWMGRIFKPSAFATLGEVLKQKIKVNNQ